MDPDQLGIVLRVPFLDEFFPETADGRPPDSFTVYHYNGLVRSNPEGKVSEEIGRRVDGKVGSYEHLRLSACMLVLLGCSGVDDKDGTGCGVCGSWRADVGSNLKSLRVV